MPLRSIDKSGFLVLIDGALERTVGCGGAKCWLFWVGGGGGAADCLRNGVMLGTLSNASTTNVEARGRTELPEKH